MMSGLKTGNDRHKAKKIQENARKSALISYIRVELAVGEKKLEEKMKAAASIIAEQLEASGSLEKSVMDAREEAAKKIFTFWQEKKQKRTVRVVKTAASTVLPLGFSSVNFDRACLATP